MVNKDFITKISMKKGNEDSNDLEVIDKFYVYCPSKEYIGWVHKEVLCNLIKVNHWELYVNIYPYPLVIVAERDNVLYLKSEPNKYKKDNLLCLPRE